jgi:hypothetical protein
MALLQSGLKRRREFVRHTLMTLPLVGEMPTIIIHGTSSLEYGFRNAKQATALLVPTEGNVSFEQYLHESKILLVAFYNATPPLLACGLKQTILILQLD